VLFALPAFLLLSILSFTQETQFLWDSSVQYNPLVASTSLRRINGHLPAHGRVCGYSMRCASSAPLLPISTPHLLYLSLVLSWIIILSFYYKTNATPVVFRFGLEGAAMSIHGVWQLRAWYTAPSRGVTGVLVCAGLVPGQPAHEETCPTPRFSFSFVTPPCLCPSLDQIFFCFRSIFTLFSARHAARSFYFHLLPLRAMHSCPPL
jgi:hypothetical protein